MRLTLQILSWIALAGTVLPSLLFFYDAMPLPTVQWVMLLSMILWFVATPLWMGKKT